jgi:formamidopyrimidine-DNA glycosylase
MPELPEVETTLRGIEPHLIQHTIQKVTVRQPQLRWLIEEKITDLEGATILHCERRAKYIIMHTNQGGVIWHLGMSGTMRILKSDAEVEKHDHVDIFCSDDVLLRYTDPRRFGACIYVESEPLKHKLLSQLGPEPLSELFNADYLFKVSRTKNTSIKQFIMNSHIVCGVGNIYACESLFKSAIHPTRKAGNVSKKRYIILVNAIKNILQKAIREGGTTLKDFTQSDGKPGYFKQHLNVYGRKNELCFQCQTPLKTIKQAQRTTFYCGHCQH